jgi:hypothetical protein
MRQWNRDEQPDLLAFERHAAANYYEVYLYLLYMHSSQHKRKAVFQV